MTLSDLLAWTPLASAAATLIAAIAVLIIGRSLRQFEIRSRHMVDLDHGGPDREAVDALQWRALTAESAARLAPREDSEILGGLLRDLRDQLDVVAEEGAVILGSPDLARAYGVAWHGPAREALEDAIDQIETDWNRVGPYMELAGLTGPALQFKAQTVEAFLQAVRMTPATVADGPPDPVRRFLELVRSGKLLGYLKSADVVWESVAAALAVAAPVAAGLPPSPADAAKLGKHGTTELKKMTEAILERFKRP